MVKENQLESSLPFKITEHLRSIIDFENKECPIGLQFIPSETESIFMDGELEDPLAEEPCRTSGHLIHAYSNRGLFLVSRNCPAYCRFCFRKRLVGTQAEADWSEYLPGFKYLKEHREIDDVILSGGEPFLRDNDFINKLLKALQNIESVKSVRFHTRILTTLPSRIDSALLNILQNYPKVKFINTHFNHYKELTPETVNAIASLRSCGISLNNQSVLLKGINDTKEILVRLNAELYHLGVRPYYIFHLDSVPGTRRFRVSLKDGMELHHSLQGYMSGLAVPVYALDAPKIRKVWLNPRYVEDLGDNRYKLTNHKGESLIYDESQLL